MQDCNLGVHSCLSVSDVVPYHPYADTSIMSQIADLAGKHPEPSSQNTNFLAFVEAESKRLDKVFSKDEINELRKKYRKAYFQNYYYERKKNQHRLTLRLSKQENRLLKQSAKQQKERSLNTFIKKISLAYLEEKYVPRDTKPLDETIKELRAIGRNINQVIRALHRSVFLPSNKMLTESDMGGVIETYENLHETVTKLEKKLVDRYESIPGRLDQALAEFCENRPERIGELIEFLEEQKKERE